MALKTVVDTLDGLDEAVKSLYAEKDGKFILQIEGVDQHPDVANLKSAYERVKEDRETIRTERDTLKSKVDTFPADFDAEKWAKAKEGKADEAALISLRQTLEAERDEWKGKAEASEAKALKNALDRDLTDALTAAGVTTPMFAKLARGHIAPDVKMTDAGPVVETDMGPLALVEYVKRWAAGEGKDFVKAPEGGGAPGGKGGGAGKKWGDMTSGEKVALHRENPEEYQRIKAAG
ncbi:hypothetical protein JF540_22895 [Salipiger thiooxidans]|uniref:hypothetical protein n=1 Tax=Salipiger thiooxidans TaxID=282683 RepID=UPI001A8D8B06|nr:hypothetical protein [Salipiger thiooxidans]MBN8189537.1 hypothetical protein [Salipiger thiooxidans]